MRSIDIFRLQNGYITVDEAHSNGVLGACGRGVVCEAGLESRVFTRVLGFGKAIGCAGGTWSCSERSLNALSGTSISRAPGRG